MAKKMDKEDARRIQSAEDKKGSKGDQDFKARAMSAAEKKPRK